MPSSSTTTTDIFGPWFSSNESQLDALQAAFAQGMPFPHVVIENFFDPDLARALENGFPIREGEGNAGLWRAAGWHVYDNPIEGKLAFDRIEALSPAFQTAWNALQAPESVERLRKITRIPDLETDPHLHGAGLHYHPVSSTVLHMLDALSDALGRDTAVWRCIWTILSTPSVGWSGASISSST